MSLIKKVWGTRQRLIENEKTEVDLLYLDKDTACSIHSHTNKINRFILIHGNVHIKTDLGTYELRYDEPFDCEPPLKHQFIVYENSIMIEIAYVKDGQIENSDIKRVKQGGKFIDDKFYTLDELKDKNWLEYKL